MDFCKKCDNMCYMKINDKNDLIHFCKYCGYEDNEVIVTKNLKVLKFSKKIKIKKYILMNILNLTQLFRI